MGAGEKRERRKKENKRMRKEKEKKKKKRKLPLTPMNYQALAICLHELPSATPDPLKLPNPSQQPLPPVSSVITHGQRYYR
jgi:hypothetical protein